MKVADLLAEFLIRSKVRQTFGVGGANIEDVFLAVQRRRPQLEAVLCKHEHAAGTAADAYARLGGGLGVVLVTSGGAAMNLVHAIAEARASRVPLLAVVGEPPTHQQGRGAFQDTSGRAGSVDARAVFAALTPDCVRLQEPGELLPWLERLCTTALGDWTGPRVLLLAKDIQCAELALPEGFLERLQLPREPRPVIGSAAELAAALSARPVAVIAGAEVARRGAQRELALLVDRLDARVAVAPDARDAYPNDSPRFAGVVGVMGHAGASAALERAGSILLVGTRLSLLERVGLEALLAAKTVAHLGSDAPFLACAARVECGARLAEELRALSEHVATMGEPGDPQPEACASSAPAPEAPRAERGHPLRSRSVLELLDRSWPEAATVLVDAGNTGASATHHLRAPRGGRWLLAMGMAGMGYTYGAAIGAAFATGRRVFVVSGDGAFFMHGLEVHTAVEHQLPITYLVLDNAAHGMCLVREQLLLGENSGYNVFRRSQLGAGLAAMFPGLPAFDCDDVHELHEALGRCRALRGPCFISARLPEVEVPPFAAFASARARGITSVERSAGGAQP